MTRTQQHLLRRLPPRPANLPLKNPQREPLPALSPRLRRRLILAALAGRQ